MEKKQTAVEWLAERCGLQALEDVIAEAKEMEKEQIMEAVYDSMGTNLDPNIGRAELYYKEKYGNG
jgi:hypothetical protein